MSPKISEKVYEVFVNSVKNTKSSGEVVDFLDDLLTPVEKIMLAKRVAIAFLLLEDNFGYEYISKTLKVSRGTIARVNSVLITQGKGYKQILGNMLRNKALKIAVGEMLDNLNSLPPMGVSWKIWKKDKVEAKRKREEPL